MARQTGYEPIEVRGAGFPFFNVYKLLVILRGRRLVHDLDEERPISGVSRLALSVFEWLFRFNANRTRLGWQVFGVFRR
jgi:hypothetical protein